MKQSIFARVRSGLVLGLAIAVATGPVVASDVPDNLSDLYYQQRDWSESQLRSRNYSLQDSDWHEGKLWQYWWNGGTHHCLRVEYDRGEVASLHGVSGTDCGQYHEEATKDHKGAAVAVGALAILGGLAALSHKSHHRGEEHGEDPRSVAEFERGYRDGLHREDYHNYSDTRAYSDGYSRGVEERHEQTSYRARSSSHSGYRSYAPVNDLVGARASGADSELRRRGFSDKGGYKQGGGSYVTWWNAQTRQCIQVVTREGRIDTIGGLAEGNCL